MQKRDKKLKTRGHVGLGVSVAPSWPPLLGCVGGGGGSGANN